MNVAEQITRDLAAIGLPDGFEISAAVGQVAPHHAGTVEPFDPPLTVLVRTSGRDGLRHPGLDRGDDQLTVAGGMLPLWADPLLARPRRLVAVSPAEPPLMRGRVPTQLTSMYVDIRNLIERLAPAELHPSATGSPPRTSWRGCAACW